MGYHPRKHVRHKTDQLPIILRAEGTFVWRKGSVLNLSAGGVQIHSHERLIPGLKLEIEFNTVDRQGRKNRRKFTVTVVWNQGQRYGCQFETISPNSVRPMGKRLRHHRF